MKRFFTFLKTELKLSLRDMNMLIFAVIMPLVIFIILGVIYGAKPAYDGASYTFLEQSSILRRCRRNCDLRERTHGPAAGCIRSAGDENSQAAARYAGQPRVYSWR